MDPPPRRSLAEIAGQIPTEPDHSHSLLELVAAQIQHVDHTVTMEHGADTTAVSRLARFMSSFLAPLPSSRKSAADRNSTDHRLVSMSALDHLTRISRAPLDDDVLLAIIPYANATSASSTDVVADAAEKILSRQFCQRSTSDFIVSVLLETAIRPHVSKWSSTRLTATGRAAAYDTASTRNAPTDLGVSSPWADEGAPMIPLFQWALNESDATLLERHWSSFTPFLLALLDDTNSRSRVHGLHAAEVFVRNCPPRILAERGIGKVLEEAILPTLQFLPSHTPEAESAQLLEPAYTTLVLLARTRFSYDSDTAAKRSLLDKLLREGIFSAYSHASEYARIIQVLAVQTKLIVEELGIYATKHLKDVIPIFSSVMMDPFLVPHSQCLLSVAEAFRSTILNCWPRVLDHYGAEILRTTIVCWLNVCDISPMGQAANEKRLRETLQNLATLMSTCREGFDERSMTSLSQTIEDRPELRALFS